MLTVAAKVARYFTIAAYMLVCMWVVFGVGQMSAAGGFFAAIVAVVMLLRVMDGWNNVVAAAEYEYIIGSGRARVLAIVVGALVEGAIAYGFYYLSQWIGDASPWWYVTRFFMVNTLFSLWMIVFSCVCDIDTSEGKRVRKALR
jgi:hypothetical protein